MGMGEPSANKSLIFGAKINLCKLLEAGDPDVKRQDLKIIIILLLF
jgi:hypothetical protein